MPSAYLERYVQSGPTSLAFVKYPDHLMATRDRGSAGGSRFTFKDNRAIGLLPFEDPGVVWPTATKRGTQSTFYCHLFGEIVNVVQLKREKSVAMELGCPKDTTCAVKNLFRAQISALHDLIQNDVVDATGVCTTSWFRLETHSPGEFALADTFWVYCVPGRAKKYAALIDSLAAGTIIHAGVGFQRFHFELDDVGIPALNYYATATRVSFLDDQMIPKRGQGYTCDRIPAGCETIMLARMISYGPAAVALADYDKDFVAVRQASLDGGSLFAFKRMPERDQTTNYGMKESLQNYVGSLFGEVTDVYTLSKGLCILRIKMPSNASCALRELWDKQLAVLRSVLDRDDPDLGGVVKSSYLDYSAIYPALYPIPGTFFVCMPWSHGMRRRLTANKYVIGRVTFVRFHGNEGGKNSFERYYHMEMRGLKAKRVGYFPTRGPLYSCDSNRHAGCQFCGSE
ncbi:hypothetical protein C8F04DRAFT_1276712 [Mycena alexandri]|uniref:Uncharacterized protein n=1 Tax=Mycena alexandri TaxID=1745969 RepID=A0AAD6S0P8_9AGAR|nr:hypothetical protein C8F04DRAFT_1276712 [Mycena alexandri]